MKLQSVFTAAIIEAHLDSSPPRLDENDMPLESLFLKNSHPMIPDVPSLLDPVEALGGFLDPSGLQILLLLLLLSFHGQLNQVV